MKSYRELIVWQKGIELVREVYKITGSLPREETYVLADQLRRAAISVPSNIAEGNGRLSTKEYIHHLSIARGSLFEVETQLVLCVELGYIQEEAVQSAYDLCGETGRLINAVVSRLRERI